MKKVLLVSPLPPPVGGIASWTVNILDYFKHYSNSDYELIHLNSSMKFRSITSVSMISRIFYGILNFMFFFGKFFRAILKKPDVCHITSSASFGLFKELILVLICKATGSRAIIHYRFGRIPELEQSQNWEWQLLSLINRMAYHVIVLDENSFKILNRYGNNVSLIGNPISPELMKFKIENFKAEEDSILFVGHVTRKKGVFELFSALRELNPNCKLHILGPFESNVKEELEKIYSSSHGVSFYGAVKKDQVYKMMSKSKMLVLPSHTEGFPNVIIEGMALGCSIIASSVGAIPEMLAGNRGIIVPPCSVSKLRDSISKLLNNEAERLMLSKNAERFALENYSMESIVKKLEKIWL
ncbi:glycosyltransferase family 4 protein [Sphingobacterium thalpophilum]|uniref:glycosyltransferase family 4 protein n=1 Tax=Sphingobacterium thalpophilum TaxID=259 RepID=UPI002D76F228|nr:glycosyltransferase family 4 protein [Sphingobacterium thalpophilum]